MNAVAPDTFRTKTSCGKPVGAMPIKIRKKDASGLTIAAESTTARNSAPSGAFFTTEGRVPFHMLRTMYVDDGERFLRNYVPVEQKTELPREVALTPSDRRYLAGVNCE